MKIVQEIELDDELLKGALKSCMENYPECSTPSLQCVKWKYEECRYVFQEMDDNGDVDESHVVVLEMLVKGFEKMMQNRPCAVPPPPVKQTKEAWEDWCCQMDADGIDCLLQYALFGELIYG